MTVTVAFDGTVIDTADTAANWAAIKITSGGQAPTAVAADAAYEGLNNVTCRSDNKRVYMYTDIGAGNELDFTSGSTGTGATKAPGDLFYIWVNFLPSPLLAIQADGGLGIFMSTNTPSSSNYALWYFHGRDTYTGGWVRLAIDPTKTPSIDNDTFDPGNVRYFGAFAHNNQGAAKYDNFVVDQCAYGKGLIVTGTSTLGLIEELITDEEANRRGIVTSLNDTGTAVELLGNLTLGDNVGTSSSTITDEDSKIFVAEPLYYETTLKASCPLTFAGVSIVGNATGATDVSMGVAVGVDKGRNGISLVGNPTYDIGLDRDDTEVESADFYGSSLENLTGALALDGTHDFNGDSMAGCGPLTVASSINNLTSVGSGQITLAAGVNLIDSLIINSTAASSVSAALASQVNNTSFTSDGSNNALDLGTIATTATHSWNCTLSGYVAGISGTDVGVATTGNEAILVSVASGQILTISVVDGSSIPSVANTGLGTVNVISGLVTLSISTQDNNEVRVRQGSFTLQHNQNVSGGIETYSYTYVAGTKVTITVGAPSFIRKTEEYTLTASDTTLLFTLDPSPSYIL